MAAVAERTSREPCMDAQEPTAGASVGRVSCQIPFLLRRSGLLGCGIHLKSSLCVSSPRAIHQLLARMEDVRQNFRPYAFLKTLEKVFQVEAVQIRQ